MRIDYLRTLMRIVIGADHAGFPLKQELIEHLTAEGHMIIDVGTDSTDPVDYPDYAAAVARAVVAGGASAASSCVARARVHRSRRTRSPVRDVRLSTTTTQLIRRLNTTI
jgi:hypothetical protein